MTLRGSFAVAGVGSVSAVSLHPARRTSRKPLLDPRAGDVEDDVSSPADRSLLSMAGSLIAEINLLKVGLAIAIMILMPAIVLGLAPLLVTGWYGLLSRRIASLVAGIGPILSLVLILAAAWIGGRPLFRTAERSFWSLTSLIVQPAYVLFREALRDVARRLLPRDAELARRARARQVATAAAGFILAALALWAVVALWPSTRWIGQFWDLRFPQRLVLPTLANSGVLIGLFLAGASLYWAVADATMRLPVDHEAFDEVPPDGRIWRVAHVSDLHAVGGRHEFRIESGRLGPQGNGAMRDAFGRLSAIHKTSPLEIVLVTGDMTDAGRSVEWAEFLDAVQEHPELGERMLLLPGNHDLNVVDRTNPARLELPTSWGKRLRQMRALSAMAAIQGDRVLVVDRETGRFEQTLSAMLELHADDIRAFADTASFRLSSRLAQLWDDVFPMVLPPPGGDGLGVIILNSNAETHFSFTNALGLVPAIQGNDMMAATRQFPRGRWIVALHHHLVEYPRSVAPFASRVGTALVNASSFVRQLAPLREKAIAMHGHRHVDWIGAYGDMRIVSAPSPVMGGGGGAPCFYVHRLAPGEGGRLLLLEPERVELEEAPPARRASG